MSLHLLFYYWNYNINDLSVRCKLIYDILNDNSYHFINKYDPVPRLLSDQKWYLDFVTYSGYEYFTDQKHHITILIPQSSGHYTNGQFKLTLEVKLNQALDTESAGWDNIRVVAKKNDGPGAITAIAT